jgi:hypothetical protein
VKIVNLYSGHGTYSTLGLGHTDIRVKDRMLGWVKEMVNTAAEIDSGLGFFCHAFPQKVLQDPQLFSSTWNDLIYRFSLIADYAEKNGVKVTGVEQMYSPHQVPWTIEQAKAVLSETQKHTDTPFYITLDTGHQSGQHKYLMPSEEQINQELKYCRKESEKYPRIWLGPDKAYSLFKQALNNSPDHDKLYIEQIMEAMKNTPYLFVLHSDGDTYKWLEQLAGYSPIIHLQQTDGKSSAHWAFTEEKNRAGIIRPDNVLKSIYKFYSQNNLIENRKPVEKIYLTLEMFASTSELQQDVNRKLEKTVRYWRRFIPEDGLKLDELINLRRNKSA